MNKLNGKITRKRVLALTTRVHNLLLERARLIGEANSHRAEIHDLRQALGRACGQLMGPIAPDHIDNRPPRDTRTFPWDPPGPSDEISDEIH